MKNRPIIYKAFDTTSTEVNGRIVSGYLASFGNKDSDGDVIIKGAFAKSIAERGPNSSTARKVAYLYQHDMSKPIGRFKTLMEDETGLYFEAELDNIPLANDVLSQYKSGTLNQHSIGFRYIWDKVQYDEQNSAFVVKEVDLFEGSVVTMGANENTPYIGVKSEQLESYEEELRRETEAALKHLPFEDGYKIRQIISKHIALKEVEPGKPTPIVIEPQHKPIDFVNIIKQIKTN